VERDSQQTFVCSDCIAARNFIDLPNHLKQVQILSATGDIVRDSTRVGAGSRDPCQTGLIGILSRCVNHLRLFGRASNYSS
jgi:hypothetical protein